VVALSFNTTTFLSSNIYFMPIMRCVVLSKWSAHNNEGVVIMPCNRITTKTMTFANQKIYINTHHEGIQVLNTNYHLYFFSFPRKLPHFTITPKHKGKKKKQLQKSKKKKKIYVCFIVLPWPRSTLRVAIVPPLTIQYLKN